MIVIADSGSSKADWMFCEAGNETRFQTAGINPFFLNIEEIVEVLKEIDSLPESNQVTTVFYYGAGVIPGKTDRIVSEALERIFPQAEVIVADDMLGAARALLGNKTGIACILGTGANSCVYNGSEISDKIPPLGFILGDEGSGAHLGKLFLNDYFKRGLPADLRQKTVSELHPELTDVLQSVYRGEYPSRFLAAFTLFLGRHVDHLYVQKLLKRSFKAFFERNIERYPRYNLMTVSFTGSIAWHFSDVLKEVATARGITIGKIVEKPIDGLKLYHQKELEK